MRFVVVKSEEQQSVLSLHRIREQLIKIRTMQVNQIRGLLYEFGADLPQGRQRGLKEIPEALAELGGFGIAQDPRHDPSTGATSRRTGSGHCRSARA
jgi:transposase